MTESISSGDLVYNTTWIRCRVQASFKPEEAWVAVVAQDVAEPLAFYVDNCLVQPHNPPRDRDVLLSDVDLRREVEAGSLTFAPPLAPHVFQSASIDLSLHNVRRQTPSGR
jgi:hypothetical protein